MSASYPPGFVTIDAAISSVKFVTLSAAYSGSLFIPLGLIVLYCPPGIRKSPVFPTLIICLLLGIVFGFLSFAENIKQVQNEEPSRGVYLGSISLNFLIPLFTDSVLVWKILWLFSALSYTTLQRALLILPPVLITVPRLVVISYFLSMAGKAYDSTGGGILAASNYLITTRLILAEFVLQFVSNLYCSTVLLIQAYRLANHTPALVHRGGNLQNQFMSMFRVLASSFLIPVCIELALVISTSCTDNEWIREPIQWSNTYVSLHCAVLATVWSTIGRVKQQNTSPNSQMDSSSDRSAETRKPKPSSTTLDNGRTFASYHKKEDEDIEAMSERSPSFSFHGKPTSSLSDHSPNLSFTGWEKSPDLSSLTPTQSAGENQSKRPIRVQVDYDSISYREP